MTQVIEFEGAQHEFPDDASRDEIARALARALDAVHPAPGGGVMEAIGHQAKLAARPITSLPETYSRFVNEAMERFGRGFEQVKSGQAPLSGAGNMALGALGYVTAPINAPLHTIVGEPVKENVASVAGPQAGEFAGTVAEAGAGLALPIPKGMPRFSRAAEAVPPPTRMLDVTLSEGQAERGLSSIQREQAALRGQSGPPAQRVAQAFADQQAAELAAARAGISSRLDPFGSQIADTPQAAGEVVQGRLQSEAGRARAGVEDAYSEARSYPGEIHADAFTGMAQRIKGDLSLREEPVIVDDKLTPFASQMIRDLDERVSQLRIDNRADPFGPPDPQNIAGVDLRGVDQMRKRLSAFRRDAFGSGNAADARAARAVLDAFDEQVDAAVNGGMFRGDSRAVAAWNTARAAYADYRRTFTAGRNDPVGRVVERIIGNRDNPGAIPNDVADFLYGSAGVNPNSLNVGVVTRMRSIFGDRSPEWSAVKQGLFSRLVEAGEGMTPMGPGKVAQRLSRFLNTDGREMANVLFSRPEREMLTRYADLMRRIEVPQAGANWSNTATFAGQGFRQSVSSRVLGSVAERIGMLVHATLGRVAGEATGLALRHVSEASAQRREAVAIARMMPVVTNVMRDFRVAADAAEASRTPRTIARLTLATRNLASNLQNAGINVSADDIMRMIQGPQGSVAAPQEGAQPPAVGPQGGPQGNGP